MFEGFKSLWQNPSRCRLFTAEIMEQKSLRRFAQVLSLAIYAQTAMRLVVAVNSCVNFMKDDYMLYYIGIMASMFFLMSGLRKMAAEEQTETESETEEDLHE